MPAFPPEGELLPSSTPEAAAVTLPPMNRVSRQQAVLALALALFAAPVRGQEPAPRPLPRAHAHNDYEHPRPLLDALDQGFCSVEADIHLVDGRLLVAHDRWRVKPERTLEALYLEPLQARVRANGGCVQRDGPTFWLLIDFKTAAAPTWAALEPVLEKYRPMLTVFSTTGIATNAVAVVLSGNSPRSELAAIPTRLAAIDGRPADLEAGAPVSLVPWVSESWGNLFRWRAQGAMPEDERARLQGFVERAHAQGRRVRFWGAPDVEAMWRVQAAAGVDLLNTDRLAELARFLRALPDGSGA